MGFQSTVNKAFTFGRAGEIIQDGPSRVKPWNLNNQTILPNRMGYAFTVAADGVAVVGGTGAFAGIMCNPKEFALYGGSTGTLSPSIDLQPNSPCELMDMGIIVVYLPVAAAYGDPVYMVQADGSLHNAAAAGRVAITNARVVNTTTAAGLTVVQLTQ